MNNNNTVNQNVRYKDIESKMISDTAAVKENDAKKNELETYVYGMRDKICAPSGACNAYMQATEREEFGSMLTKAEDWL